MTERFALAVLALLSLIGLWLAPWAALSRPTGARNTVLLLPGRVIDFSGRIEVLAFSGLGAVLIISIIALILIALGSLLRKGRNLLWLLTGLVLIVTTAWGLAQFEASVRQQRLGLVEASIQEELAAPKDRTNVPALEAALAAAPSSSIDMTILKARQAGFTIRRLAYTGSGMGLAAFLCYVTGILAIFFGLRLFPGLNLILARILTVVAVPAVSILLSLLVAAGVILALQPTAVGDAFVFDSWQVWLAGRIETLWHAYLTLFATSLGSVGGFAEALKFATPLIFTGLAVAFGFQAGLFNIGAPGQMVLGAVFAMLVGLYMPGPRILVLPLAVLASAVGGGIWGGIPGWLKARFGANEVINTILMNYIASSILLFILSSNLIFASAALRILRYLAILIVVLLLLLLVPALRRLLARAPRISFAAVLVIALLGIIGFGLPRPTDGPVAVTIPFKAPGSEPKSYPLNETVHLQQLPSLLGVPEGNSSETTVFLNIAAILAGVVLIAGFFLLPLFRKRLTWWQRLLAAVLIAGIVYGLAAAFGLSRSETIIPPTKLNTSFIIAILVAVFMQIFMWRTKWGYELRAVGVAPKAAEYGGANIARNTILAMTLSGAFAGLTACHYVLGGALEEYSLRQALPTNDGFDGIAVALLGGNTPIGVVLSAFLFGVLKNGGTSIDITFSGLNRYVVSMIVALVVLFIAARGFLPEAISNPLKRFAKTTEADSASVAKPQET